MKRLILAAFAVLFIMPASAHAAGCTHRNPPSSGECVAQHFGVGLTAPAPTVSAGPLCEDWSVWQGYSPSTAGLRCVIIQSNYGQTREPSVSSQMADARRHHIPFGCYTFMDGSSGAAQARTANHFCPTSSGRTLGLWADAEVNGAYGQACRYTAQAAHLAHLYGLYTAPGLWPGGRCQGLLWPAEWGAAYAYPFGGYPWSAVRLWQTCGTCGTDLDKPLGIIALSHHK